MPENNTDIKKAIEWLRQVENAKQAMLQCECMFQDLRNTQNITSGYERGYEKVKDENGKETGEIKSFTRLKSANSGGKKHDISDFIAVLEAEEQELERYKTDWLNKRIEVKKFLMSLNMNEKIKTILIFRYIGLYEWDEIAEKLGMSNTWVHNLKKAGIADSSKEFKKILCESVLNCTKVYGSLFASCDIIRLVNKKTSRRNNQQLCLLQNRVNVLYYG